MTTLDFAHDYLRRGWRVVPLHGWDDAKNQCRCPAGRFCTEQSRGKHPSLGGGWESRAFKSGANIEAWWEDHPHDNIGILTGIESGIFVLDVDGSHGVKTVTDLAAEYGPLPPTRIVRTGSGGLHYFFKHPSNFIVHNSSQIIGPGIDIRGKGGQVVAPPSTSGRGPYETISDHSTANSPEWLTDMLREHAEQVEGGHRIEARTAEPVDVELMPERVRTAASTLIGRDEGRYKHFHHIVAECREAGFTQGQTVTIVAPWCAAVDKFVGRVEAEVARCWGKLAAEARRANEWIDGIAPEPEQIDGANALKTEPQPQQDQAEDNTQDSGKDQTGFNQFESTWKPVDLEPILSGTYVPETPALFPRSDHHNLIYPGRVHSFHGESESGKSLLAQAECARLVMEGRNALYIDFESDAPAVVTRLMEMGCTADQIRAHFTYIRPDNDPRKFPHEREQLTKTLQSSNELVIIDGVTDALGVFGAGSKDNDEITAFMRNFPRMIARKTGAAVILVDHVTKDTETRGRYAVGGQAKMNALDGSAFVVEVVDPLGRGLKGSVTMRVAKDRPGGIRPYCGSFRKSDRTQEAAKVIFDSTGESIEVTVEAPSGNIADPDSTPREFRPTIMMERISRFLEGAPEPVSWRSIRDNGGNEKALKKAVAILDAEGYISVTSGTNNARLHQLLKPYIADQDPQSDTYVGWLDEPENNPGGDVATSGDTGGDIAGVSGDTVVTTGAPCKGALSPPANGNQKPLGGDTAATWPPAGSQKQAFCKECGQERPLGGLCPDCDRPRGGGES